MTTYTKALRERVALKWKAEGPCVICGTVGKLSKDHVPPQGCTVISEKILQHFPHWAQDETKHRHQIIQGGVTFQTICGNCNNTLGTHYDPALINFMNGLSKDLEESVGQKIFYFVKYKPHRVARALIGHMLAAHAIKEVREGIRELGANDALRDYLQNDTATFPADWNIFCWPYLSRADVIIKHAALMDTTLPTENKIAYGHIMKFRPFGFWLVKDLPERWRVDYRMQKITPKDHQRLDDELTLMFDLSNRPHESLPENPQGSMVTLLSDSQVSYSMLRNKR